MVKLVFASSLAILFVAPALAQPKVGTTVKALACPMTGVEGGCLVIKGQDGNTYNISSAKPRPRPNYLVVRLTGRVTNKVSTCGQGAVLDSIKWSYTRQKCSKAQ